MAQNTSPERSPIRLILTFLVVVVLPLVLGFYLAPKVAPQPKIGLVRLSTDINDVSAYEIGQQLAYAREHNDIKGLVLILNSPGGDAAYSEELYLDILNTRKTLPVVSTIDLLAASGAYYMAVATDFIYAKPTSSVGSVGVIASLPGQVYIEEELLTTGPYKAFGGTRDDAIRQIERAKFAFLQAVQTGRGDRLKIPLDVLSRAQIYTGVQALEQGMIDGLISDQEAIDKAAELAGISNYKTVELYPLTFPDSGSGSSAHYQPPSINASELWASPTHLPPGVYYRYVTLPENH